MSIEKKITNAKPTTWLINSQKHEGIIFVKQKESYSSQCSPLSPMVSKKYAKKSNRKRRGLYVDKNNTWNADTVGAYNILRLYLKRIGKEVNTNPMEIKTPYIVKVAV